MTKHNPPLRLVGLPAARRLESRKEIDAWVAERRRALDALILADGLGQPQLRFDERRAA